jgi:adenosylmethionine-8-amino-7-oxononanoate aminotransferase
MTDDRTARLARLQHEHLWSPPSTPVLVSGEGSCWTDGRGTTRIDAVAANGALLHGHRHPRIDEALQHQIRRLAAPAPAGTADAASVELAHRLANLAPWGLQRVRFTPDGASARAAAIAIAQEVQRARGHTRRTRVAVLGHTADAPVDALHLPAPVTPGGDEEDVARDAALQALDQHGEELAALVVEPLVQADLTMHGPHYLRPILERAEAHGIVRIADEQAAGPGRTGTLFAMEQVGTPPDLLCLGHALAAGLLPIGAVLGTESIRADVQLPPAPGAYPLAAAVALASLDVFEEEGLLEQIADAARHLTALTASWSAREGITRVRQTGLVLAADLGPSGGGHWPEVLAMGQRVATRARDHGVLVRHRGDTLAIHPPLAIPPAQLTTVVRTVAAAIASELP